MLSLRTRCLDLDAGGKLIAVLHEDDAHDLGVRPLDRIVIKHGKREAVAIVNTTERLVKRGEIALYWELSSLLKLRGGEIVEVEPRKEPLSKTFIRRKIFGYSLTEDEIKEIVNDVLKNNLNDLEVAAFIAALTIRGLTTEEAVYFTRVFVKSGDVLRLRKKPILDKHSLGGVPGDKTSMLVVPIIASLGFCIPKTSSRAITSPAGTADRVEVLANVSFTVEEVERIVRKINACMVWGGALNLAPADNAFIKIEYPLGLDPLYIPSILSKKKAVGATHLVLDLPTGRGTKLSTFGMAYKVANEMIEVARRIGIRAKACLTFGEQPVGNAIGPALEAREALIALSKLKPRDLIDKACSIAGTLLEMIGKGDKKLAFKALESGKALRKFREIIREQGGDEKVKPSDVEVGSKKVDIISEKSGMVMWIKNREIATIARLAGAPRDKGAGILLHKKITDRVRKGEKLFTIYANNAIKLRRAHELAKELEPVVVIEDLRKAMLITTVEKERHELKFILER